MQFTKEELGAILEKHGKWLRDEEGGERAFLGNVDLSDADLRGADLRGVDLSGADLSGANLSGTVLGAADLRDADLSGADLSGADLSFAYLSGADLMNANLRDANLRDANLSGADLSFANLNFVYLSGADLSGADLSGASLRCADLSVANLSNANLKSTGLRSVKGLPPICCPEEGSFIGWKKSVCDLPFIFHNCIVKLLIPEDARRSSATGRKCRCDKALVLGFYDPEGNRLSDDLPVFSSYDTTFKYRVGETVSVPNFDENRWNECAPGIHFFITRQEAIDYMV